MQTFFRENPKNVLYEPNIKDHYRINEPNVFSQTAMCDQEYCAPISINSIGDLNPVLDFITLSL